MAERRMFAKTIVDSDAFLDMPLSTQALYFHLSMRADDDGFINNPKKIQRMIGASEDDLKLLTVKNFIIPFESGIVVIKHWKIHNYIRGDRKKETVYPDEMALLETKENGAYTLLSNLPAVECIGDSSETARQKAYKESSLPYSFEYKIRQAFTGRICPICGAVMQRDFEDGIETRNRIPTIQHNIPISKGGKHELGNISVICKECNITLQDTETGELNALEVIEEWDRICATNQVPDKCLSSACQVPAQDRIGKYSIDNNNILCANAKPTKSEIDSYFDKLWSLYPVKKGKGQISDSKRKTLFDIGFEEMQRAIQRYLDELKKDASWRKPQNGSTFFNSGYIDYLDDNFEPQENIAASTASSSGISYCESEPDPEMDEFIRSIGGGGNG